MDYIIRYLNQQKAGISDLNQKKADTTYLKA
jgi:hypothetical protein